jgi:hypothetical protein
MPLSEHWLVYGTEPESVPRVIRDQGAVSYYRYQGWKVEGPFVLATEVERLREALDGLVHASREFSTNAAYTVSGATETEFVDALATAEAVLDG